MLRVGYHLLIITISFFIITLSIGASFASDCTVSDPGDAGPGTLRDCLDNVATELGDQVNIPQMTIHLVSGELIVTRPIIIAGESPETTVIDGSNNGSSRIFRVQTSSAGTVVMRGLTIQGARAAESGAGIFVEGTGTLEVLDSVIKLNEVNIEDRASLLGGGGIYVQFGALLSLIRTVVTQNRVQGNASGGGIYCLGNSVIGNSIISENDAVLTPAGSGGMDCLGSTYIYNTLFEKNNGSHGGGGNFSNVSTIAYSAFFGNTAFGPFAGGATISGDSTLQDVLFARNQVTRGMGGALFAFGDDNQISNATFVDNQAHDAGGLNLGNGGAIFNLNGTLLVENSTIYRNMAEGNGGGVFTNGGATTVLSHVTISENIADSDAGGQNEGNGGGIMTTGSLQMANAIVAGNIDFGGEANDCESLGTMSAQGKNILLDPIGCESIFSTVGSVANVDPQFVGGLGQNGGEGLGPDWSLPILTMALQDGSPAIDSADEEFCLGQDQRGVSRPQGSACDIGAFEWQATPVITESPQPYGPQQPTPEASSSPVVTGTNGPAAGGGMVNGGGCQLSPHVSDSARGIFECLALSVLGAFFLSKFSKGF